MKKAIIVLYAFAILLCAFGYWGAFTENGSKYYKETEGMIPFFALVTGGSLFAIAILLHLVIYIKVKAEAEKRTDQ